MKTKMSDEFWFGEDIYGNKYSYYVDKSPNDFWIETVIKKDLKGNYTVWSCDIIPKKDENISTINANSE